LATLKGSLLIPPFIGVLAVTRSLGDHTMKEFVVGNPYTTETELTEEDSFIILACDGVCIMLAEMQSTPHP
jgi:protein phosphatase PTC1